MGDSCSVQCTDEEWLNIDLKDNGRDHMVEVDVGGRLILKCILKT